MKRRAWSVARDGCDPLASGSPHRERHLHTPMSAVTLVTGLAHVRPRARAYAATLLMAGCASALPAQATPGSPWQVRVTTTPNPLPAGRCAAIWVEIVDNNGYRHPTLQDGRTVDTRQFHYATSDPTHFQWMSGNPATGYICTAATTGAVATTITVTMADGTSGSVPLANIPVGQTARPTVFSPQAPLWRPGLTSPAAGAVSQSARGVQAGAAVGGGAVGAGAPGPTAASAGPDAGGSPGGAAGAGAAGAGAAGAGAAGAAAGAASGGGAAAGAAGAGGAGAAGAPAAGSGAPAAAGAKAGAGAGAAGGAPVSTGTGAGAAATKGSAGSAAATAGSKPLSGPAAPGISDTASVPGTARPSKTASPISP